MKVKRGARAVEAAALKAIERAQQSGPPRDEYNELQGALKRGRAAAARLGHTLTRWKRRAYAPHTAATAFCKAVSRHRPRQPRARLRRLRPRPHEALQRPQERSARLKPPRAPPGTRSSQSATSSEPENEPQRPTSQAMTSMRRQEDRTPAPGIPAFRITVELPAAWQSYIANNVADVFDDMDPDDPWNRAAADREAAKLERRATRSSAR